MWLVSGTKKKKLKEMKAMKRALRKIGNELRKTQQFSKIVERQEHKLIKCDNKVVRE